MDETWEQPMYMVSFYGIPFNCDWTEDDMKIAIERAIDGIVQVSDFKETSLDWNDEHELNRTSAKPQQYKKYFKGKKK